VEALGEDVQRDDVAPFKAAVDAGVGSVMPAFVSYPSWDASGAAAAFSPIILGYLRDTLGFRGLTVTDAFIMGGATAAAPEGGAAVAAVTAGCDMLLYPTDWAGVVRSLEQVPQDRAGQAIERYERTIGDRGGGQPSDLDDALLAEHQKFADGLADRAVHLVRGEAPQLGKMVSVTIVDDDVGGPYSIPPRDVFHATLKSSGVDQDRSTPGHRPGVSRVVLVYAEPRSWKGRADLGSQSLAKLEGLVPGASLVILFAHPRLVGQVPGDVPVVCAWHGQALMQRAAARWVSARTG
jgi:beta-glucosidase-like glycosyl hydrolase